MEMTDAALAADVAADAGKLLLAVREEVGFDDPYDLGDAGDMRANVLILDRLRRDRPDDAVLSEEAADDVSRVDADRVWIVDPVDGTREFGEPGRTDWAVHVALWQRTGSAGTGELPAGAVALPAQGQILSTAAPAGLRPGPETAAPVRIVVTRTRAPRLVQDISDLIEAELVPMGSAGAKVAAVVCGQAD